MMDVDATEIVRLRDACRMAEQDRGDAKLILALLDALEQTQKERDGWIDDANQGRQREADIRRERDAAQQSAKEAIEAVAFQNKVIVAGTLKLNEARQSAKDARALAYEECAKIVEAGQESVRNTKLTRGEVEYLLDEIIASIRARIEAFLEPKG